MGDEPEEAAKTVSANSGLSNIDHNHLNDIKRSP